MHAIMDWDREARTGLSEAVFSDGKTPDQLARIILDAQLRNRPLLITRMSPALYSSLPIEQRGNLNFDELSQTAILGDLPAPESDIGTVGIVTGGISDLPVAIEAQRTLAFAGIKSELIPDIGIAGLWRLMSRLDTIRSYTVLIAVAGMEGALFSVLAGLVRSPIIAVPTSVGAGITKGGRVALFSALGSCAPGLSVVNIDNGFGAAQTATRIINQCGHRKKCLTKSNETPNLDSSCEVEFSQQRQ